MKIGERRPEKALEGPGPGQYNHELADDFTKPTAPKFDMDRRIGRIEQQLATESPGPG